MKNFLIEKIKYFLNENNLKEEVEVLKTRDETFGDYTSNIALKLAKKMDNSPIEIAEKIKLFLDHNFKGDFKKITVTKPGFINFFLSKQILLSVSLKFIDENFKPKFLSIEQEKYNYEFVSANPTGDLHIGHLRNAVVGDITINLLTYVGHKVTREYWINDYGNQIVMMAQSVLFYLAKELNLSISLKKEDIGYNGEEIKDFAKYLASDKAELFKNKSEEEIILFIQELGVKYYLEKIKQLLKDINVKNFYYWTSEREMYESGKVKKAIEKLENVGALYKKDNAIWLKSKQYGDDKDRVIIKNDGSFTYMTADIANHIQKFERGFERLINLWGADHHGYEKRIHASLEHLGYDASRLKVDFINMVQIIEKGKKTKMSKRAGTSLRIIEILKLIDADPLRYFIVSKSKEQNIILDISKIKEESSNNPFYYVQYANARANQIIENYRQKYNTPNLITTFINLGDNNKERKLLLKIIEFEDIILNAVEKKEPYVLITYQKELAQIFNSFYNDVKVVVDDKNIAEERIQLVLIVKMVFQRLFAILGIEPINKF